MKVTIENYEVVLPAKQNRIIAAIERVKGLIKNYAEDLYKEGGWDASHDWDFNLLHDLQERLEQRANEVHSQYCDFNWEKYQMNAY